jgi:hypothetical protein
MPGGMGLPPADEVSHKSRKAQKARRWGRDCSLNPKFGLGSSEAVDLGVKIVRKVKALERADEDPSGYRMEMATRCTSDTKGGIPIHADWIQTFLTLVTV